MDFMVNDLLSATPSTAADGIARTTRSASFSGPAVRKSFSSVLQGVRGEEKTGSVQEADGPRGTHKVEDRPDSKQSRGLNAASSQTEQAESTRARTSAGDKLNDGQSQMTDSARDESESALPQSNSGSAADGQVFVSMASAAALPVGAQTMVGDVPETHDGSVAIGREGSSSPESSPALVATDDSVRQVEHRSLKQGTTGLSTDSPEQAKDVSLYQKGTESQGKQSHELEVSEKENGVKGTTSDFMNSHATIQTSPSGGTVSSSDHHIARLVQTHDGKPLPESQLDRNLIPLDKGENEVPHPAKDNQASVLPPIHEDQGDAGPRTQGITPHDQPIVIDQNAPSSQSGHEQDGRQQGNPDAKLFQGTVVELPSMNGRTTESYAAVAQSQTVSVPTAPSSTVIVPPAQPAFPVPDLIQPPTSSILRSVVLDVAQPDLGHVNIRVAMMNDSVHAHFSTDRVEVGQFLLNGQDRLQTSLQANGFDMGQFRVDIDRQNGGRSFQQGLFQEQGQSTHQGSQGAVKEQSQGWSDEMYRPLRGRLNVVA